MDLVVLMRKARIILEPYWLLSIGVCVMCGLLLGVPSELNSYGEAVSFLLAGPLQLGLCIFFLNLANGIIPTFYHLLDGFKPLLTILLAYTLVTLLTLVGFVFLVIPGFVVALGFSMTYYIIAENPEITFNEAMEKSWNLTHGFKMELFILNLRFIPWYILGLLCFIVGVFAVVPWHNLTLSLYYQYLKEHQSAS
ncbi:MAG: putative membrane protein [Flavobacteriaceae bacterium]|jgi:uncharacterized membrane protein|tara:strand:- start:958 stop:1542 length:585 start_codon:yes stop_codon:yes gene_type:complete